MPGKKTFQTILDSFRKIAFSERDKGDRFERLIQAYLQTDPQYANLLKNVWLWNEFPAAKKDFGGKDTGIDLVARTLFGEYWAIQCKFYQETSSIDKKEVDSFLSTSSKKFFNDNLELTTFAHRLWISTTNKWSSNAEETLKNQQLQVNRIGLAQLQDAPVDWAKLEQGLIGALARTEKKSLRPHQITALNDTHKHFETADRGKLIMACGTGKTFTSLKIAEHETDGRGLILFLVPSIALLGQTLREWFSEADNPINAICICSDSGVTKIEKKNTDTDGSSVLDLALPASTNVKDILKQFSTFRNQSSGNNKTDQPTNRPADQPTNGMTVVFSTYQSIEVISEAQKALLNSDNSFGIFDLIICDEAHRTTGVTLAGNDASSFVKVHDNTFIQSKKRLYMTATPRLYDDNTKSKAAQNDAVLCSMDEEKDFGKEIYRIGFGEAVKNDLLSDYKVLILTLSDTDVPAGVQKMIADGSNEINTDDASKLIGCINALSKQVLGDAGLLKETDPEPMRRGVAFCASIDASKKVTKNFNETSDVYTAALPEEKREKIVAVRSRHVDGTMSAPKRYEELDWLKADTSNSNECRVLTNARCLSEGVDVPTLDAVLFLSAKNSQIDVVQSVGRVMRKSPGKKYGYIIIPIIIPGDVEPDKALDDNDRYKVVWTVLNALRAHDDRFNAEVNKIELNKKGSERIIVGRPDSRNLEDEDYDRAAEPKPDYGSTLQNQLQLRFEQIQSAVWARVVIKVGDRRYWEQWARDVAQIAERYVERINRLLRDSDRHKNTFSDFLRGLQKNINPSITQSEAVDMLAQHIITKPVFEALFEGYSFVKNNPISVSMQTMLDLLEDQALDKDAETLLKFYESVRGRATGINNAEGKQRIIIELYDKFFKTAFPKMVEQLGIVYTPVEVVDFIIHSVDALLKKEFARSLSDENIHVLDPFTGTGTFMTRLLQSGLIDARDVERKYKHELHANEIVLLAYYIAAINIENAFHDLIGAETYTAFDGICLTDTFQLGETDKTDDLFSDKFPQNSERVLAQKKAPLRVIIGNPPYSVGQKSANDNAQNQSYDKLDARIENTYAKGSNATSVKSLYDSYIKAFRWSSDRLDKDNGGIIAFVSNGAWLDGLGMDGFRKCLEKEFSAIYVFDLRGNQRTSGELSRQEGGKIFGSGSRTPIAISFLIKKPAAKNEKATICYHDIGDYLSREEKLSIVKKFGAMDNTEMIWQTLTPNEHGDWLNQRADVFETFVPLAAENKFDIKTLSYFVTHSLGIASARDAWVYNFSSEDIRVNMQRTIEFYNHQANEYAKVIKDDNKINFDNFASNDATKISWNDSLRNQCSKNIKLSFQSQDMRVALYRPFVKNNLYFDTNFIQRPYQQTKIFSKNNLENRVICISGVGASKDFSALIVNLIPSLDTIEKAQCFPLYYYEEQTIASPTLFDAAKKTELVRRDGVSDYILGVLQKAVGNNVGKEDIFYYVYGFLHSPTYRTRFASDLKKMLPRLPLPDSLESFWSFSKAGRKLAELHINYENAPRPENIKVIGEENNFFRVEKMKFPSKDDKTKIIFNSKISIENIPAAAYEYVVNGKSAIEWIMERYAVTTHKESGIRNDPNDWADEVGKPKYILDLLLSIITVSLETMKIVNGLPEIKLE